MSKAGGTGTSRHGETSLGMDSELPLDLERRPRSAKSTGMEKVITEQWLSAAYSMRAGHQRVFSGSRFKIRRYAMWSYCREFTAIER